MKKNMNELSKRERQILDIVYREGEATAARIRALLPDDLSDSGVRTILRVMLEKNVLKYREQDTKYVYFPSVPRDTARLSALEHVKKTFFENSAERIMATLLKSSEINESDLERLEDMIRKARKEEK